MPGLVKVLGPKSQEMETNARNDGVDEMLHMTSDNSSLSPSEIVKILDRMRDSIKTWGAYSDKEFVTMRRECLELRLQYAKYYDATEQMYIDRQYYKKLATSFHLILKRAMKLLPADFSSTIAVEMKQVLEDAEKESKQDTDVVSAELSQRSPTSSTLSEPTNTSCSESVDDSHLTSPKAPTFESERCQHVVRLSDSDCVSALLWDTIGRRIYAGKRGRIRLWDVHHAFESTAEDTTTTVISPLRYAYTDLVCPESVYVRAMAMSYDANMLAVAGESNIAYVWHCGQSVPTLVGRYVTHSEALYACTIDDDYHMFTGGNEGSIIRWDLRQHKYVSHIGSHSDSVTGLVIVEHLLFTCGLDSSVKVWDVRYPGRPVSHISCQFPATSIVVRKEQTDHAIILSHESGQVSSHRFVSGHQLTSEYMTKRHWGQSMSLVQFLNNGDIVSVAGGDPEGTLSLWQQNDRSLSKKSHIAMKETAKPLSLIVRQNLIAVGRGEGGVDLYRVKEEMK